MRRPSRNHIARVRKPSLVRRGAALAVVCVFALAGCGTEEAGGEDPKAGAGDRAGGESVASSSAGSRDAEFLAFMELLSSLAEPCFPDVPVPPGEPPSAALPSFSREPTIMPLPEESFPDEPPPTGEPMDPMDVKKEVPLRSTEKCAARVHSQRITKALESQPAPAPQPVKKTLRGLGYIDERIHGPQRSGDRVEFTLDLRILGGELCLSGNVTGTKTVIEPYGASSEVDCTDVERRR
ncbi:hypothetical protein ACWEFL_26285 [Streptomyces sp. NPDC004838]